MSESQPSSEVSDQQLREDPLSSIRMGQNGYFGHLKVLPIVRGPVLGVWDEDVEHRPRPRYRYNVVEENDSREVAKRIEAGIPPCSWRGQKSTNGEWKR